MASVEPLAYEPCGEVRILCQIALMAAGQSDETVAQGHCSATLWRSGLPAMVHWRP